MHGHSQNMYVGAFCFNMLPSVKFAEDKVLTFLILREKCYNSGTIIAYFRDLLLADVKKSNTGFTVHYDETTTIQIKKQLDVILRYWLLPESCCRKQKESFQMPSKQATWTRYL